MRAFEEARIYLKRRFEDHNAASKAMYPLFGRDIIRNFFESEDNRAFDTTQIDRLIWYSTSQKDRMLHDILLDRIGIANSVSSQESRLLSGKYKYFRYYAPAQDPNTLVFISGDIEIIRDSGLLKFEHNSHNYRESPHYEEGVPEHTGYVLKGNDNLFFIGTRSGTIRLGISERLTDDKKDNSYMRGLVVSVRSAPPHDPFSARFVMVPIENEALISKLSDGSIVSVFSPELGRNIASKAGEEEFFRITQGRYAYLMLSTHLLGR